MINEKLLYKTLYNNNNGSQSAITLSDNVSNYSYLEIIYGWNSGGYGLSSVKMDLSKNYTANISQVVYNNNYLYLACSRLTASNNKLTPNGEYWRIGTSGNATRTTTQQIAIYKVLGYK